MKKKKKSLNHLQSNQAPRSTWPSTPESTYMYTNGKFKISFLSLKLSLLAASPLVNTPPYCPSVVNLPATLANPWAEISQGNSLTQMLPKELHKRLNLYLTRQNSSLGKQTYFRSSLLSTWWGSGDWLEQTSRSRTVHFPFAPRCYTFMNVKGLNPGVIS